MTKLVLKYRIWSLWWHSQLSRHKIAMIAFLKLTAQIRYSQATAFQNSKTSSVAEFVSITVYQSVLVDWMLEMWNHSHRSPSELIRLVIRLHMLTEKENTRATGVSENSCTNQRVDMNFWIFVWARSFSSGPSRSPMLSWYSCNEE